MSLPPGPPPTPDAYEAVGPEPMKRPVIDITIDWSQLPGAATALGVSLVGATTALGALYARMRDDLDGSNFTMGVLGALGLLAYAAVGLWQAGPSERRAAVVTWPGAAGALSAGLMLAVLVDDDKLSIYLGGGMVVALSVAGYVLTRSAPFVLSTIFGLALLYAQGFDDVISPSGDGDNTFMVFAAAIVVFVVVVTAAGWLLPETRVLTGVVVGAAGLFAITTLFEVMAVFGAFMTAGASFSDSASSSSGGGVERFDEVVRHNPYENDVYVILICCAVLALLWIACTLASGHVGFRVLVAITAVISVPPATLVLSVSHPTWWEVVTCALGALVLLAAALLAVRGRVTTLPSHQAATPDQPPS